MTGSLTVIAGCMFAGKTTSLIAKIQEETGIILCFKPCRDTRYADDFIVSHEGKKERCRAVLDEEWESLFPEGDHYPENDMSGLIIVIDEAQFVNNNLPKLASSWKMRGAKVIIAGLDLDSFGNPFGDMPHLKALADELIQLTARCSVCDKDANRTYRKPGVSQNQVHVGGADDYEPRCEECWKN